MFERYTERARRIIFFARYEAGTARDGAIGPEHLLLGLMREDKPLWAAVAGPEFETTLAVELKTVFSQQPRREVPLTTSVDMPLSESAKLALHTAEQESIQSQSPQIHTAHFLLALLKNPVDHPMFHLLKQHGITYETARSKIPNDITEPRQEWTPPTTFFGRFTNPARRVIFYARYEAAVARSSEIGPEHLLLGLLRADQPLWRKVADLEPQTVAGTLRTALAQGPGEAQPVSTDLPLSASAKAALLSARTHADTQGSTSVETRHLLLGLLQNHLAPSTSELLNQHGITYESARSAL